MDSKVDSKGCKAEICTACSGTRARATTSPQNRVRRRALARTSGIQSVSSASGDEARVSMLPLARAFPLAFVLRFISFSHCATTFSHSTESHSGNSSLPRGLKVPAMPLEALRVELAWKCVRDECALPELFGDQGAAFLEETGAIRCLHPFLVGTTCLATMAALSNGGRVRIWTEPSPLCVAVVLVNPPQSRTSQATSLVRGIGLQMDAAAHARARAHLRQDLSAKNLAEPEIEEALHGPWPSSILEGFTPEVTRPTSTFSPRFALPFQSFFLEFS